ncbi:IS5 family transposase [Neosynechococcus sphagnicola]|uniref:IS5 family transposase n=1 Tax=Neosynechococcus sphagnicola TaxID=1501145 RepID=UPI000907B39C|nr:IS5 family transposase [Neosynechococcus sphagnicola]
MLRKEYPSDLTDAEWKVIEPFSPAESAIGHPREVDFREIVNAIFYVQREGCTWRGLPGDFPPWQSVYNYLRHWQRLGIWQQIHDQLRIQLRQATGKTTQPSAAILDSQSVKTTDKFFQDQRHLQDKKSNLPWQPFSNPV